MNDIKVFLSEEEIKNKVAQLGKQISEDYRGEDKNLILIAILKGSVVFLSDLMRNIDIDLSIDFMVVFIYNYFIVFKRRKKCNFQILIIIYTKVSWLYMKPKISQEQQKFYTFHNLQLATT